MSKETLIKRKNFLNSIKDKTEVYSRIVGYYRSVNNWNLGKKEEFKQRKEYEEKVAINRSTG